MRKEPDEKETYCLISSFAFSAIAQLITKLTIDLRLCTMILRIISFQDSQLIFIQIVGKYLDFPES